MTTNDLAAGYYRKCGDRLAALDCLWKKPSMAFFHECEPQKSQGFLGFRCRRIQRRVTLSTGC